MSNNIFKVNGTNTTGAIAVSGSVPTSQSYRLVSVTCKFDAVPASENFTVTLNANAGAVYDTVLYTLNPATGSTTDILYQPTYPLILEGGDSIDVAFANSNNDTYGVQITFESA